MQIVHLIGQKLLGDAPCFLPGSAQLDNQSNASVWTKGRPLSRHHFSAKELRSTVKVMLPQPSKARVEILRVSGGTV